MRALRRLLVRALQRKGTQLQAWHIQSVSCICRAARALAVIRACASAVALRAPAAPPAFGWVGRTGIIDCACLCLLLGFSRSAEARVWRAASLVWQQRAGWGRAQPATGIPAATLHACFGADFFRAQLVTSSRFFIAASSRCVPMRHSSAQLGPMRER